jgi:hypothetical protein
MYSLFVLGYAKDRSDSQKNIFNFLARDEVINIAISTNGESQRRVPSANRQHLNETMRRLAKPKNIAMTQSIHIGAIVSSPSNGIPLSRSSHQIRLSTAQANTTRRVNKF